VAQQTTSQHMITLFGQVLKVFKSADRTDRETGEVQPGAFRVQIMGEMVLPNGESRFEVQTLKTEEPSRFNGMIGKTIMVPVGVMATETRQIIFYMQKGAEIREVGSKPSMPAMGTKAAA
jgi:hypothetical protein